jgi:CRP-like cAMP-binding protein
MLRNHTLSAMQPCDLAALRADLSCRIVERGDILTPQGEKVTDVYFPTTAHLSNVVHFRDGQAPRPFLMGVEGVSGLAAFLADEPCLWSTEVHTAGEVYRLPATALRGQFEKSEGLRALLLRRAYDYQAQAALAAACASVHDTTSRLASSLLIMSEKLERSELELTQDDLGVMLGVQRTTLNASALVLRDEKAISYSRGRVRILDQGRLRAAACECYGLYHQLGRLAPAA